MVGPGETLGSPWPPLAKRPFDGLCLVREGGVVPTVAQLERLGQIVGVEASGDVGVAPGGGVVDRGGRHQGLWGGERF
jgi:hypothetical protein